MRLALPLRLASRKGAGTEVDDPPVFCREPWRTRAVETLSRSVDLEASVDDGFQVCVLPADYQGSPMRCKAQADDQIRLPTAAGSAEIGHIRRREECRHLRTRQRRPCEATREPQGRRKNTLTLLIRHGCEAVGYVIEVGSVHRLP